MKPRRAMKMAPAVRRVARIAAVALCLACGLTAVRQLELPEDPIAVRYRTPEEARRRAENYQDSRERAQRSGPAPARPQRGGRNDFVATGDVVNDFLSRILGTGTGPGENELYPGRLALLYPRTREVEVIRAARRGSIPLAWSRDHQRLLFAQPLLLSLQIYEYSRTDDTVRAVTLGPMAHAQACYGPEGRIVVAAVDTRETPVRSRIAVSGPGGRAPFTTLTQGPADHSPACHPDGQGIAFVRETAPPRTEIFFLDGIADATPRRLSPGRHPSFSPDGEWLAFAAPAKRELRLWRIRPDGSGRAPIGRGLRHETRPAVSPDGRLVAYVAAEDRPRRHLYLRRFDGSGDRILFAHGDCEFPVW